MGGIGIDGALQVGFMLRALLHKYHAIVQEFRLGRHSLTEASLQTVVDQCTNYDKDPWKGPVDKNGKVVARLGEHGRRGQHKSLRVPVR